jgi:wyosine [tRNA(Phe)-imidazoG37] synthetase (radical SAM superfamily)
MTGTENLLTSSVYGPVKSWRVGNSLGVDLLFVNSICSFRCIYCQLGKINEHTRERKLFVSTEKVMADLKASHWQEADVITFSGSGEPTLAANLGEAIRAAKAFTDKPIVALTNATLLNDAAVRNDLRGADKIFCKLDVAKDRTLRLLNRPVTGITVQNIIEGIKALRQEYCGHLAIQTMLLPLNQYEVERLAMWLNEIQPDEVQLNVPSRPIPHKWFPEARGNSPLTVDKASPLKLLSPREIAALIACLHQLTGVQLIAAKHP